MAGRYRVWYDHIVNDFENRIGPDFDERGKVTQRCQIYKVFLEK